VANYCVLNQFLKYSGLSAPTNGNLTIAGNSANWRSILSSFAVSSGKWYCEINMTSVSADALVGIFNINNATDLNDLTTVDNRQLARYSGGYGYQNNGNKVNNNAGTAYGSTWTTGDVIGIALDMDAGTIVFYKNNTSQGTAYSSLSGLFAIGISTANGTFDPNFGQRPFTYTPPSGFVALNTYNLPTPTILQGNLYMSATSWTGNGTTNVIVNQSQMKPDAIWIKTSSAGAFNHHMVDSVRGVTKVLIPNSTGVEVTSTDQVTAINSNGFTLGADTAGPADREVNVSGSSYIGWQWQAGQGSTSSNTSGSITSTVSVNTTAGFSVVTWTGNGTIGATIGHGLGVAPSMIIVKQRSGTEGWATYHISLGATKYLNLNQDIAAATSITRWNNTTPSSTVITFYNDDVTNRSGGTYVAYCWAEIAGFSKFGSYIGNGSTNGPFMYLGFRPRFVMIKRTDSAGYDWWIYDTTRDSFNSTYVILRTPTNTGNAGTAGIDITANGFRQTQTDITMNASGGTYIYMAFAENPFKNANAR
jgi:hypothetical protein